MPDNIQVLQHIDFFSVQNVLSSQKGAILPILKLFCISDEEIGKIIDQYSNIQYIKWINKNNTISFWSEVKSYRDAGGNIRFEEIANFVLKLLSLPWSNADIERVFSQMNIIKTNLRNRLHLQTVNSVLAIRYNFSVKFLLLNFII